MRTSPYRDSYLDMFPGVWRHGDWIRFTPRGSSVIYGRSDSTINRAGIRMGTAEIYRVVEAFAEVQDSLVIDMEYLGRPWERRCSSSHWCSERFVKPGRWTAHDREPRLSPFGFNPVPPQPHASYNAIETVTGVSP